MGSRLATSYRARAQELFLALYLVVFPLLLRGPLSDATDSDLNYSKYSCMQGKGFICCTDLRLMYSFCLIIWGTH